MVAVGSAVIDRAPGALERSAIALFGQADKLVLNVGVVTVSLAAGAGLGAASRRRRWPAIAGFLAFAALGYAAALGRTGAHPLLAAVGLALAAAAGLVALHRLLDAAPTAAVAHDGLRDEHPVARRRFLTGAATALAVAALSAASGRWLAQRVLGGPPPGAVLPDPVEPLAAPAPEAAFDVPGLTPVVVPNADFYRIDTALIAPRVDAASWRLRITGMVQHELTFTYDDLLARPQIERYVTIACVSNEVGGGLVGNAAWRGIPLRDLLEEAGVDPRATQVVGRAVDGWTAGFPTEIAVKDRESLVALGMNGEPLPVAHGYPARLVVPGLYGYVSATKWLEEIELTTLEAFDAYWVPRGWTKLGPVKTQSRIDVPTPGRTDAGTVTVAGVAWAPDVGIDRVEVQVDDGTWREAELSRPLSDDAWVQWRLDWRATPGPHRLRVRATDGRGETQPEERTPPFPDGATGYHTVTVTVA